MNKNLSILILAASLLAISCKKYSKNDPAPASANTYFPVTSGTSWTYNKLSNGSPSTYLVTMTGATINVGAKKYYTANMLQSGTTSTAYYYVGNHQYSIRAPLSIGGTVELQLANDNQPVGYTWTTQPTDNGYVNGVPAQTVNKILEAGISKTINGKAYSNVIHTQVDLQYDSGFGFESNGIYDFYLAKGVGMIEEDSNLESGAFIEKSTLTSYSIK